MGAGRPGRKVIWGDEEWPSIASLARHFGGSTGALRSCIENGYRWKGKRVWYADTLDQPEDD